MKSLAVDPRHSMSRLSLSGSVVEFALGGYFGGILLHPVLQWRHLLTAITGPPLSDFRMQLLMDGLFHVLMYVIAVAGLTLPGRGRLTALQSLRHKLLRNGRRADYVHPLDRLRLSRAPRSNLQHADGQDTAGVVLPYSILGSRKFHSTSMPQEPYPAGGTDETHRAEPLPHLLQDEYLQQVEKHKRRQTMQLLAALAAFVMALAWFAAYDSAAPRQNPPSYSVMPAVPGQADLPFPHATNPTSSNISPAAAAPKTRETQKTEPHKSNPVANTPCSTAVAAMGLCDAAPR